MYAIKSNFEPPSFTLILYLTEYLMVHKSRSAKIAVLRHGMLIQNFEFLGTEIESLLQ